MFRKTKKLAYPAPVRPTMIPWITEGPPGEDRLRKPSTVTNARMMEGFSGGGGIPNHLHQHEDVGIVFGGGLWKGPGVEPRTSLRWRESPRRPQYRLATQPMAVLFCGHWGSLVTVHSSTCYIKWRKEGAANTRPPLWMNTREGLGLCSTSSRGWLQV